MVPLYSRIQWEGNICCKLFKDWDGGWFIKYEVTETGKPALDVWQISCLQETVWHIDIINAFSQNGVWQPDIPGFPKQLYASVTGLTVRKKKRLQISTLFMFSYIINSKSLPTFWSLDDYLCSLLTQCLVFRVFFLFFSSSDLYPFCMCSSSFII